MKKGTYQSRRRVRKIRRFVWKMRLTTKVFLVDVISLLIGLVFRLADKFRNKTIRLVKRGEGIYEGIKK